MTLIQTMDPSSTIPTWNVTTGSMLLTTAQITQVLSLLTEGCTQTSCPGDAANAYNGTCLSLVRTMSNASAADHAEACHEVLPRACECQLSRPRLSTFCIMHLHCFPSPFSPTVLA